MRCARAIAAPPRLPGRVLASALSPLGSGPRPPLPNAATAASAPTNAMAAFIPGKLLGVL